MQDSRSVKFRCALSSGTAFIDLITRRWRFRKSLMVRKSGH